ncbi:MAG: hypothetical protein ACPLZ9_00455 [Candidatus Ratteibacteria bacterium]
MKKLLFVSILLLITKTVVFSSENLIFEQILAGLKYHQILIKDWKVKCILKGKTLRAPIPYEKETTPNVEIWASKQGKIYYERKKTGDFSDVIVVFNGEILQVLGGNNKGAIQTPTERQIRNAFLSSKFTPFHLLNFLSLSEKPITDVLEKTNQIKNLKITEEILNGEGCYLLDFIFVDEIIYKGIKGKQVYKYSLWLNKNKGFLPVKKIETWLQDENSGKKYVEGITEVTEIKKFEDDRIWFPIKAKQDGKVYNEDGSIRTHVLWEIKLETVEINKGIPDNFFEIKFPKGTKVWDERTGVTYEIK